MLRNLVNLVTYCVIICWTADAVSAGPSRAAILQAQALRTDGELFLHNKKPKEAIRAFAESYILFQSTGVLMLLGRAMLDNGQYNEAAEFCQRFLQEKPEDKEVYVAQMCRTMAVASGSGESLVDLNGLNLTMLHDLNLADAHMLLGNYALAEKFAEHFLSEIPPGSSARRHAVRLLRKALVNQGKRDPYLRQPRPRWRKALGAITLIAGLGMSAWGLAVLAYDGHCLGDFGAEPKGCPQTYHTAAYGGSMLGLGLASMTAGTVLLAVPGRPPERQAWQFFPTAPALAFEF